jgi:hypothetical protein
MAITAHWSGLQPATEYEVTITSGTELDTETGSSEYERFERVARSVVHVSKDEITEKGSSSS